MTGWRDIKLKDVSEYVTVGFVGSMAEHYVEAGVPFLRSLNIQPFKLNYNDLKYIPESFHDAIKKSKLRPDDVAIVRTGYPGTACVIPEDLPDSNCSDLVILRPGPELNPHYIAAVFNSSFGQSLVGGNLVGAAQQHFNVTVAKELKLRLPPRAEQDKIAAVLVGLNDLIANNQRRIALLESMAEEIYREWFVRMRFPRHEDTPRARGLPLGWALRRLSEVAKVNANSIRRGAEPEFIAYLDISAVGTHSFDEPTPMRHQDAPGRARRLVQDGDIIWSSVRPGNKNYCLILDPPDNLVASTGFAVISPKSGTPFSYLSKAVTTQEFTDQMVAVAKGSAYPATSFDDFEKAQIIWPSSELLATFHERTEPMLRQVALLRAQCRVLAQQRDTLLPRLIAGKLRVDHLDIQFPPSMQPPAEAVLAEALA